MDAQINHHSSNENEILVYKNDFYHGVVLLIKKLFMI